MSFQVGVKMMGIRMIVKNNKSGFTLLEMLLALAILAVVFYSISAVLNSYFGVLRSFTIERENIYEARMGMDQVVGHIVYERKDKGLTLSILDSNHLVGLDVYNIQYNLLSKDPIDMNSYDLIYNPGTQELCSGRVANVVYAKNIENLTFTNQPGNNIELVTSAAGPSMYLNNKPFIEIMLEADKEPVKEPAAACSLTTYVYSQ
ncbi:MAG: type II secretion system protein J [Candidatus Saccharibacteria bacterium]